MHVSHATVVYGHRNIRRTVLKRSCHIKEAIDQHYVIGWHAHECLTNELCMQDWMILCFSSLETARSSLLMHVGVTEMNNINEVCTKVIRFESTVGMLYIIRRVHDDKEKLEALTAP